MGAGTAADTRTGDIWPIAGGTTACVEVSSRTAALTAAIRWESFLLVPSEIEFGRGQQIRSPVPGLCTFAHQRRCGRVCGPTRPSTVIGVPLPLTHFWNSHTAAAVTGP